MSLLHRTVFIGIVLSAGSCMRLAAGNVEEMVPKTIVQVLKKHTPDLMAQPGVVGTAQSLCEGRPCIRVFVDRNTPELQEKIPRSLEGYPVRLEEVGEFRALPDSPGK